MKTIKIGTWEWTSENLHVKSFANGDEISYANSEKEWIEFNNKRIPAYCHVDYNSETENIYGLIYNWHVIVDKRPLVQGYRIPSNTDWNALLKELVGYSIDEPDRDTYWDLLIQAGNKIKSKTLWESFGIKSNGTNLYGFNAVPAGGVNADGKFSHKGVSCSFWSHNSDEKYRWHFNIDDRNSMKLYGIPKINWGHGRTVRLIKI